MTRAPTRPARSFARSATPTAQAVARHPLLDGIAFHPYPLGARRASVDDATSPQTTIGHGRLEQAHGESLARLLRDRAAPARARARGRYAHASGTSNRASRPSIDPAKAAAYTGRGDPRPRSHPRCGWRARLPAAAGRQPRARSAHPDSRCDAPRRLSTVGRRGFSTSCSRTSHASRAGSRARSGPTSRPSPLRPHSCGAFATATAGTVNCDALKGGRPSGDYTAPSAPTAPTAIAGEDPFRVDVQWAAVADDSTPVAYRVYRGGALVATTNLLAWTDTTVSRSSTYTYVIRALDAAGNLGNASLPADVATPAAPPPTGSGGGGGGGGAPAALSVSLEVAGANLVPGQDIEARVVVRNAPGVQTALDTRVVIVLPDGVTLLGAPFFERGSGCFGTNTLTCLLDFLPAGSRRPFASGSTLALQASGRFGPTCQRRTTSLRPTTLRR